MRFSNNNLITVINTIKDYNADWNNYILRNTSKYTLFFIQRI